MKRIYVYQGFSRLYKTFGFFKEKDPDIRDIRMIDMISSLEES